MRYLSFSKSTGSNAPRFQSDSGFADPEKSHLLDGTGDSTVAAIARPLPSPNLKIKKVDHFYSRWSHKWKYENTGSNVIPEIRGLPTDGKDDPWQQYCFVVVREIPREVEKEPYFKVVVKSQYLLKGCKDVIGNVPGISWHAIPLELDSNLLLAFLPRFQTYRDEIKNKNNISKEESHVLPTVQTLIDYLRKDYRATVAAIENLTSHGEITFDLLFSILVPRSIMVTTCPVTGELQASQLVSSSKKTFNSHHYYGLVFENVDVDDTDTPTAGDFSRVQSRITIPEFAGTVKITSLVTYPMEYHPHKAEIRLSLLARGRKWANISRGAGIHHLHYKGIGAFKCQNSIIKYNLNSRVMIDRANFKKINPNYAFPKRIPDVVAQSDTENARLMGDPPPLPGTSLFDNANVPLRFHPKSKQEAPDLTDDELILTSPVLWGFSLSDKLWLELNVENVSPVEWNETAFTNIVLPLDRKMLLQSLVEAHNTELGIDDFIKGKGRGLVVNLFGPPGVGKTLSAEATSEHVKRPLYVVGAGDLGTKASDLDIELQRVFELATAWKAIVLIDEADVFLEQRSLHDLERNAMVAVFLRHLEYYPSILFLTTNRVKTFDEAFLSRIHIALHFHSLSEAARGQVWIAFLNKAGIKVGAGGGISQDELKKLTARDINGRQVKNATKTAQSLAVSRGETLRYMHLAEVLDVMEQFSTDFQKMRAEGM